MRRFLRWLRRKHEHAEISRSLPWSDPASDPIADYEAAERLYRERRP